MGIGQEQLTNTKKDNVVQLLDILKHKSLSNKEASRLINDIISLSKDDTVELHRSKRGLGKKSKLRGNLGSLGKEAAKEYVKDLVEEFIDYFSSSSEEQFTGKEQQVTEEQSRDFVEKMLDRGVLEEVWDRGFVKEILRKVSVATNPFRVLNKLSEALNKLFETNEQQVTEVPQTTEDQQVTTEVPQVTGKQQNTKKQQVMNEDGDTALHLAAMKDCKLKM